MQASQVSSEQIMRILDQGERGAQTIGAICREHQIAETTFYRWRKPCRKPQVTRWTAAGQIAPAGHLEGQRDRRAAGAGRGGEPPERLDSLHLHHYRLTGQLAPGCDLREFAAWVDEFARTAARERLTRAERPLWT